MKKIIANTLIAIIVVHGLSAFGLAVPLDALPVPTDTLVRIKSAINTGGSGKCLDVAGGLTGTGTPIVQFGCHQGVNQVFWFQRFGSQYIIKSALNPDMCVGISNNVHANANELVRLVPCRLRNYDVPLGVRWTINNNQGLIQFQAVSPSVDRRNTCIDVGNGSHADSLWMQLYYCHTGSNQRWTLN